LDTDARCDFQSAAALLAVLFSAAGFAAFSVDFSLDDDEPSAEVEPLVFELPSLDELSPSLLPELLRA
jgi:hypothetical protein